MRLSAVFADFAIQAKVKNHTCKTNGNGSVETLK
jgi:hypothetical protein